MSRLPDPPDRSITPPDLVRGGNVNDALHSTRAAIGGFNIMLSALSNRFEPCPPFRLEC